MSCRIGITTDPDRRKKEWERELGSKMRSETWKILDSGLTKSEAQRKEDELASEKSCQASPGGSDVGDDNEKIWSVYYFEYD